MDLRSPEVTWQFATDTHVFRLPSPKDSTSSWTQQFVRFGIAPPAAKFPPPTREITPTPSRTNVTLFFAPYPWVYLSKPSPKTHRVFPTPSPFLRLCQTGKLNRSNVSATATWTKLCYALIEFFGTRVQTCLDMSDQQLQAGKVLIIKCCLLDSHCLFELNGQLILQIAKLFVWI